MAEIELKVMTRQCLKRRIDNLSILEFELAAWVRDRNNAKQKINWQFTTEDARVELVSLNPKVY